MFVILVYDIGEKRVAKVLKNRIINFEEDSVIIYQFRTTRYSSVEIMGIKKGGEDNFL